MIRGRWIAPRGGSSPRGRTLGGTHDGVLHTPKVAHKVLYGTGAFLLNRSPAELVEEVRQLPITSQTAGLWLWTNAATLLQLQPAGARHTAS